MPVHAAEPELRLVSAVVWDRPESWFGGLSGLEIDRNGRDFIVIGDRGSVIRGRMIRLEGRLSAVEVLSRQPLRDAQGRPLGENARDVEGLALGRDGRAFVSLEDPHRVARIDLDSGRLHDLPGHEDFNAFAVNRGLEALAIHPDGRLFALAERRAGDNGTTRLYQFHRGHWRVSHQVPLSGPFVPVGADFDDAGRLYVLERTLSPLGFRSRIRRLDLGSGPGLIETLLTTGPGRHDNLETLSVWRDQAGDTRLTLISDDNFLPVQRTEIVEYVLKE
ncbi:esterase-like activity of phytase family protein [Marimonas sp. MJW-29]|uniref:Esterase-like activity of phytase family protein n=1 Tax=Sulfitobacter sediminis TaxID=3234186 RepID=A0ABV3RGL1_9RHOB